MINIAPLGRHAHRSGGTYTLITAAGGLNSGSLTFANGTTTSHVSIGSTLYTLETD